MVVEPIVLVIVLPPVVMTVVRADVVIAAALALPVVVAELALPVAVAVLAVERTERAEPPMVVAPLARASWQYWFPKATTAAASAAEHASVEQSVSP